MINLNIYGTSEADLRSLQCPGWSLMSKINAEKLLTIVTKSPILQARRKREGFGGLHSPQIFAKADLLSLENDSVKEKIQKNKFKFLENCW